MMEFQVECKRREKLEAGIHFGLLAHEEPTLCPAPRLGCSLSLSVNVSLPWGLKVAVHYSDKLIPINVPRRRALLGNQGLSEKSLLCH